MKSFFYLFLTLLLIASIATGVSFCFQGHCYSFQIKIPEEFLNIRLSK